MSYSTAHATARRSPAQTVTIVIALVFTLVGVLGFVPGITSGFDSMTFAGHHSDARLLGVFEVSVLHNVVHLLFGIVGILMARTAGAAITYLVTGGAIYFVLFLYGLLIDLDSAANFVPVNDADNWLHLALAVGMLALGAVFGRQVKRAA
jgi:archaellum biogenesis protein FlaJ (TadC family)